MPAVVSDDHADESNNVAHLAQSSGAPRPIAPEEVTKHNEQSDEGSYWAVVDGFVVEAGEFLDAHPGGLTKLLSSNAGAVGATGKPFGFSFSRGRNAHFPDTGRRFSEGVKRYMSGKSDGEFLPPAEVAFASFGKIVILGKLKG